MIPMPPAADTAPTSSGLLHGYIAPQMSGTRTRACWVRGVCMRTGVIPNEVRDLLLNYRFLASLGMTLASPQQPVHRSFCHDVAALVANVGVHVVARIPFDVRQA